MTDSTVEYTEWWMPGAAEVAPGDDAPFAVRLAETVAWCAGRADPADPAGSLRSARLRPNPLAPGRAAVVHDVVWQRALGLDPAVRRAAAAAPGVALAGGRLLAYYPDGDLACGGAEAETGGFFDVHNAPPWDTWVGLYSAPAGAPSYGACVVAWVPPAFAALAGRGVWANPEQCIAWLAEPGRSADAPPRPRQPWARQ